MTRCARSLLGPVLVTAALAVLLLTEAVLTTVPAYAVGGGFLGVTAVLAGAAMAARDPFEARLAALVVSSVSGVVATLVMVVGTPGSASGSASPVAALVLACAVLLPVLLVRHARACPSGGGLRGPYPSVP